MNGTGHDDPRRHVSGCPVEFDRDRDLSARAAGQGPTGGDLDEFVRGKFDFDVAGHVARPDVFLLILNAEPGAVA